MGSDDSSHPISSARCNTGLSLGLGLNNCQNNLNHHHLGDKISKQQQPTLRFDHIVPSLSLGTTPVDQNHQITISPSSKPTPSFISITPPNPHLQILPSSNNISPVKSSSSYSNTNNNSCSITASFKRSSDQEGDKEDEVEGGDNYKVVVSSSRVMSDEDEEASPRKKLRLTKDQSAVLEDSFKEHSTLNPNQKQALAKQLHLRPRQVEVWFQNRRARTKLKQTEMDRELLKKCCETLTEENKKLQREILELKALNNTARSNNQAAALSVCTSCERRAGATHPNYINNSHHLASHSPYNNGTATGVSTSNNNNNPPRELSFSITSSSAAC